MFKWLQDRHRVVLENEIKRLNGDVNYLQSQIELLRSEVQNLRGKFSQAGIKTKKTFKDDDDDDDKKDGDMSKGEIEELRGWLASQGFK